MADELDIFSGWLAENLDPCSSMLMSAEQCLQGFSSARTGLSIINRMNKLLRQSNHRNNVLNHLVNGRFALAFKLISQILLSGYTMYQAIQNDDDDNLIKGMKVAYQSIVMGLSMTALLCPGLNIPIVLGISTHDALKTAHQLKHRYAHLQVIREVLRQQHPQHDAWAYRQALSDYKQCATQCNQDIQQLICIALGIIGVLCLLCPPAPWVGAILLLASSVGGLTTQCHYIVPWLAYRDKAAYQMGLFKAPRPTLEDVPPEPGPKFMNPVYEAPSPSK